MKPASVGDMGALAGLIAELGARRSAPLIVAIDGRSGVGKSTMAKALARHVDACVIEGDDFYAGGVELRSDSRESRVLACIDWTRQRAVLEALAASRSACWRAFDWEAFDGRLRVTPTVVEPRPVVILEGVYSARPELADAIDLRVVVVVPDDVRLARLIEREGSIGRWEEQWHEAEEIYFDSIMRTECFDVVFTASEPTHL